jgi:hypothetical protein
MRILSLLILFAILFFSNQKTKSPHGTSLKESCSSCHSSKGWQVDKEIYSFDHKKSKFPLVGQHNEVTCKLCHPSLVFSEAHTECYQCHNDVHQSTVGSDCSRCHTPDSWLVNNISGIHQTSRFPLLGAHKSADCYLCHKSENLVRFDVTGTNCIDCHRQDFMATTNPKHIDAGFSENCSTCHPVNSFQWSGAGFNHNFFALLQGHSTVKCTDCHTTGRYSDAQPECNSCHQKDYLATINPNHTASNFPVTCGNCHTLAPGWKPASFDHSRFPLTLGHSTPACIDCHIGGNYASTPTDCFSCHKDDYNNSINPKHQTLSFSVTCTECHTTNPEWKPASYAQHDSRSFPIYSGKHRGEWNSCTDCHSNASNYSQFTCISCHEHNKTDMDKEHRGQSGYSYDSASCFRCHPKGNAD